MKKTLLAPLCTLIFFTVLSSCNKETEKIPIGTVDCSSVTFEKIIFPLVESSCGNAGCHGANALNGEMLNYSQIKAFADNGELKTHVLEVQDMPQGGTLTSEQLGQVKCWLDAGAPNN